MLLGFRSERKVNITSFILFYIEVKSLDRGQTIRTNRFYKKGE